MSEKAPASPRLAALFRRVVRWRGAILAGYVLVIPVAGFLALRIPSDNAIERMMVESDPDYAATRAFQNVFPEPPAILLLAEVDDPFHPDALEAIRAFEQALSRVPHVSALQVAERLRPGISLGPGGPEALRRFLAGTSFFRRQALVGDHFLGLALILLTLGVSVLLGVAVGALFGFSFTIVSSLVPLTLMVTSSSSASPAWESSLVFPRCYGCVATPPDHRRRFPRTRRRASASPPIWSSSSSASRGCAPSWTWDRWPAPVSTC